MKVTLNIGPLSDKAQHELNKLKKGEVSGFVRDAIEFYVSNREQVIDTEMKVKLDYALEKLEVIENILSNGVIQENNIGKDKDGDDEKKKRLREAEQIFAASLSNFL